MTRPKLKTSYAYVRDEGLSEFAHGVVLQITTNTYFAKGADRAKPQTKRTMGSGA